MGSSRSEMQCPEFESPMDHQKERTPDRVCVLFMRVNYTITNNTLGK